MDSGFGDNDPLINENLFEGDIILPKGVSPRNMYRAPPKLWPNGRVPYMISEEFDYSSRYYIDEAIKEFSYKTCIKFVPKRKNDKDYVFFVKDQKCKAHVGKSKQGDRQFIYLSQNCQYRKPVIQHEMMHALGNV